MSAPKLLPLDPALVVFAMVDVRSEASSARSGPRRLPVTSLARSLAIAVFPLVLEHWKPPPARGVDAVSEISPL